MLRIYSQRRIINLLLLVAVAGCLVAGSHLAYGDRIVVAAGCGDVNDPLPKWITDAVAKNKNAYVKISKETGVPWQMLAAIHYRETGLGRYNPSNGYGIFQFTPPPKTYKEGPVSYTEFVKQLRAMANRLQDDYVFRNSSPSASVSPRKLTINETNINLIKNTLFSYNGRSGQYANQATKYGFDKSTRPYEGSPYVMNMFDCKRSSMGIITKDYGPIDGKDTRYGAFTLYARLKSSTYWRKLQGFEFKKMSSPRWMQLKQDTKKIDPFTKEDIGSLLLEGRQIYFDQKIIIDGKTYLRTEHDTDELFERVIPIELVEEVDIDYTSLEPQRWFEIEKDLYKTDPRTKKKIQKVSAGTQIYGNSKIEVGGTLYIRSEFDAENTKQTAIPYSAVNTITPEYVSMESPRWLMAEQNTKLYDLRYPGGSTSPLIPAGTIAYFNKKVTINGSTSVRNNEPTTGQYTGTPLTHLRSLSSSDISTRPTSHRAFRLKSSTRKTDISNGMSAGATLASGQKIYIEGFIDLGNERYLRTAFDSANNNATVIDRDLLEPVEVNFQRMSHPRSLRLKKSSRKIDPVTKQSVGEMLDKSRVVSFSQKIVIEGKTYLRTKFDVKHSHYRVIPISLLSEI